LGVFKLTSEVGFAHAALSRVVSEKKKTKTWADVYGAILCNRKTMPKGAAGSSPERSRSRERYKRRSSHPESSPDRAR
jgi:hypothetical protein